MSKPLAYLLLGAAAALASCQSTPPATETTVPVAAAPAAPAGSLPGAKSQAMALMQVGQYLSSRPDAALYVLDSARVNDNGATWQVLVPRTDWADRMPNRARFEVNKASGEVSTAPVK